MQKAKNPKSESDNPPAVFTGRHDRTVTDGRMSLAPEWRKPGWPAEYTLVEWPLEDPQYLMALPPHRWEIFRKNLAPASLTDELGMRVQRLVLAGAERRSLDNYGRLPLPDAAVQKYGLGELAVCVGADDRFEIWGADRLKAEISNSDREKIKNYLAGKTL